jgi:hypothetical protein
MYIPKFRPDQWMEWMEMDGYVVFSECLLITLEPFIWNVHPLLVLFIGLVISNGLNYVLLGYNQPLTYLSI